jgi:hypothetical protein
VSRLLFAGAIERGACLLRAPRPSPEDRLSALDTNFDLACH